MKHHFVTILLVLFSSVLTGFLLYVFYATELRERLEDLFFDVRTVMKPQILEHSRVAIVTIDSQDIEFFGKGAGRMPVKALLEVLNAAHASKSESLALLLPHQDFEYEDEALLPLVDLVIQTPHVFLGIFDYYQMEPSKVELPALFRDFEASVAGAGTLRKYRQGVIREIPLMSYLGNRLVPQLVTNVALRSAFNDDKIELLTELGRELTRHKKIIEKRGIDEDLSDLPSLYINYWEPESFTRVRARDLVQKGHAAELSGKIVLIGYTTFRPRSINHRDGTHVNTPWQGEESAEEDGVPLLYVKATMLENLLTGSWLRESSVYVNVFQTALLTFLSFFIWRMVPSLAVAFFLLAFSVLLYVHGFLFSYAHLLIPMADTTIFSVLTAIAGAFLKAQHANKSRTLKEIRLLIRKELALTQDRFLNRFAFDLFDMNKRIFDLLDPHRNTFDSNETSSRAYKKVLTSCQELHDYLEGIRHYSLIQQGHWQTVSKRRVAPVLLVQKVCNQFEQIIEEKGLTVKIDSPQVCEAWSDDVILEPVLFNLISNAIKYSPEKGSVSIRVECHQPKKVAIRIRDEGEGIPEGLKEKIFEKFYRIQDDRFYRVKGNGLGLYLCRFFAERIGAKIEVRSTVGVGSEFSIILGRWHPC